LSDEIERQFPYTGSATRKTGRVAEVHEHHRRPWPNHQHELEEWMSSMIAYPALAAHPDRDAVARRRADRLARATSEEMRTALAYLSMIDAEAFEIAFAAVPGDGTEEEEEEPLPVCRRCGALAGIFPDRGLGWRHFKGGDGLTSGAQRLYDPGHRAEVTWLLPGEGPEELLPERPVKRVAL
jgi:hypothetical protein